MAPQLTVPPSLPKFTVSQSHLSPAHPTTASDPDTPTTPYILHLKPLPSFFSGYAYSTSVPKDGIGILESDLKPQRRLDTRGGRVTELLVANGGGAEGGEGLGTAVIAALGERCRVAAWDLRSSQGLPVVEFVAPKKGAVLCCDLRADGLGLASGGETGTDGEIVLDLWDVRNPSQPMHSYTETHSDDITSVSFHPTSPQHLLSTSTSGLLAIHNPLLPSDSTEDDSNALTTAAQVGASVARGGWCGADAHGVWSRTDMDTVSVWDLVSGEEDAGLERRGGDDGEGQVRGDGVKWPLGKQGKKNWREAVDYAINCQWDPSFGGVGIFAGSQTGDIALITAISPRNWETKASLTGGHLDIVRSAHYNPSNGTFVTGGEDGRVCLWSMGDEGFDATGSSSIRPVATGVPGKERYKPY